jgi:hypothetical protein
MGELQKHYEVLGIDRAATAEEIRTVYLREIKKQHPDVGGDDRIARQLNDAYRVLSNPEKRAVYDHTLDQDSAYASEQDLERRAEDGWASWYEQQMREEERWRGEDKRVRESAQKRWAEKARQVEARRREEERQRLQKPHPGSQELFREQRKQEDRERADSARREQVRPDRKAAVSLAAASIVGLLLTFRPLVALAPAARLPGGTGERPAGVQGVSSSRPHGYTTQTWERADQHTRLKLYRPALLPRGARAPKIQVARNGSVRVSYRGSRLTLSEGATTPPGYAKGRAVKVSGAIAARRTGPPDAAALVVLLPGLTYVQVAGVPNSDLLRVAESLRPVMGGTSRASSTPRPTPTSSSQERTETRRRRSTTR